MSVAILDANVLIPNALCDYLLRLAEEDVYRPRWSAVILDEVRRNLPMVAPQAIERRIAFMNTAFDDALVSGFDHLVSAMTNHPKDRHVLAAAIAADADLIITCNLKDFPVDSCRPHGVEAVHPDDFLLDLLDRDRQLCLDVLRMQAAHTGRNGPRLGPRDVVDYLAKAGATRFADALRVAIG